MLCVKKQHYFHQSLPKSARNNPFWWKSQPKWLCFIALFAKVGWTNIMKSDKVCGYTAQRISQTTVKSNTQCSITKLHSLTIISLCEPYICEFTLFLEEPVPGFWTTPVPTTIGVVSDEYTLHLCVVSDEYTEKSAFFFFFFQFVLYKEVVKNQMFCGKTPRFVNASNSHESCSNPRTGNSCRSARTRLQN
jgi:hypothetical protein